MSVGEHRFKYLGGTRTPLGGTRELFRHPLTGDAVISERETLAAAALCRQFATIEAHAPRVQALLGAAGEPVDRWTSLLRGAAADGVLLSARDIEDYILARLIPSRAPCAIDRIGIPTRNRPRMLERLLRSLAGHLREWGRRVTVCVLDDSPAADMQRANLEIVRAWARDPYLCVSYGNHHTRRRFAMALAKASGMSPALASFAIESSPRFPVSTGAARNAILLETVGHGVLYLDDDVQCTLAGIPGARDCVRFQGDEASTWFFESWDDVRRCELAPLDLIGAHERMLALDRRAVDSADPHALPIDASQVSSRFLKAIRRGNARVAVSLTGVIGDSGWDDPFGYFLLGDETLGQLARSEETYRAAMKNRLILHGPRGLCVSDQVTCHSMCMAVDNTSLLPPFSPVMRGQDLVFGALLTRCVPDALMGVIPAAILHEPGERRQFASDAAVVRAGRFMTGETLALLARIEPIRGSSPAALMRSLGVHLRELTALSDEDFQAHVRAAVAPMLIACLQQLDAAIARHARTSPFWTGDALEMREAALEALNGRNHAAPSDLEGAFGQTGAAQRFRRFTARFGSLLTAWPALVEASARLHEQGVAICSVTADTDAVADGDANADAHAGADPDADADANTDTVLNDAHGR